MAATLLTNFGLVPLVVWALALATPDPAVRLGVYLALLVPCTDWFIVLTHLGRGDAGLATASTPTILLAQFVLLPLYLRAFMGETFAVIFEAGPIVRVFVLLILLPLAAAATTQRSGSVARAPAGGSSCSAGCRCPAPRPGAVPDRGRPGARRRRPSPVDRAGGRGLRRLPRPGQR